MKVIQLTIFVFIIVALYSCNSGSEEYSDAELETLKEAQLIHNEAIAIFSQTKNLLDEMTNVKAELTRKAGIKMESGEIKTKEDSIQNNTETQNNKSKPSKETENNSKPDETLNNKSTSTEDTANVSDTTKFLDPKNALEQLNEAQAAFMEWMRNVYQVPHYAPIFEDEKTNEDPAVGMDFDANMLLTDMEFKEYPEGTSPDEIRESQKKMKEEIMKVQKDMEQAIKEARRAYIYSK